MSTPGNGIDDQLIDHLGHGETARGRSLDHAAALDALTRDKPLVAEALVRAERSRQERLSAYLPGVRLAGLEQLFGFLDAAQDAFEASPALAPVAFLIRRVRADYQTALECGLSGYLAVASDAMRDVMEVESLIMDFAAHPGSATEWLSADSKTRRKRYSPAAVRDLLRASGVAPYSNEGFEPIDYKAHSEAVHVTPGLPGFMNPGLAQDTDGIVTDLPFIEMFEHGARIATALELYRIVTLRLVDDNWSPLAPMDKLNEAHERTQEMQTMFVALLEAPSVLEDRFGREPSAAEVLMHVRERLLEHGPRAGRSGSVGGPGDSGPT